MNDQTVSKTTDKPSGTDSKSVIRFFIPVLLLILVIAGVGYFAATRTGIDKAAVEAALRGWSQQLKASSGHQGAAPIEFDFDSVEMAGSGTDRHAIVINPAFKSKMTNETTTTSLKTPKAKLFLTSADFSSMRIELSEPLQIFADDKAVGNVRSEQPFIINAERKKEDKIDYVSAKMDVPTSFTAESYADEKNYKITQDSGAVAEFKTSTDGNNYGSTHLVGSNLVVAVEDKTVLAVSKYTVDASDKPAANNHHAVALKADVQEISMREELMPYGALTFMSDVAYTGPLPKDQAEVDWSAVAAKLNIAQLQLKNAEAYVSVKGELQTGQKDMLPIGKLMIKAGNFPFIRSELLKHGLIAEDELPMVNSLFKQMTGQSFSEAKDMELVLSREPSQSLKLGNITLEQGLAIVLSGGKLSPKTTEQPADAQPKAAPDAPVKWEPESDVTGESDVEQPEEVPANNDSADIPVTVDPALQ